MLDWLSNSGNVPTTLVEKARCRKVDPVQKDLRPGEHKNIRIVNLPRGESKTLSIVIHPKFQGGWSERVGFLAWHIVHTTLHQIGTYTRVSACFIKCCCGELIFRRKKRVSERWTFVEAPLMTDKGRSKLLKLLCIQDAIFRNSLIISNLRQLF